MNTASQGITPIMATLDDALDIIAVKLPDLAARAAKIKARPNNTIKAKAANSLIAEALSRQELTAKDRKSLAAFVQPVADKTRSAHLPPVRVTPAQLEELVAEADALGVDLSTVIRRRLFAKPE